MDGHFTHLFDKTLPRGYFYVGFFKNNLYFFCDFIISTEVLYKIPKRQSGIFFTWSGFHMVLTFDV